MPSDDLTLMAWARALFGEKRSQEISASLIERAQHMRALANAELTVDEEPATLFRPAEDRR